MIQAKENRPGANGADSKNNLGDSPILAPEHAGLVHGVYVAVIQIRNTDTAPRYRRRVFLNLPAANRAISRARMDGLDASIVLCQLTPVEGDLNA